MTLKISYTRPVLYPKQEAAIFNLARLICIEASTKSGKCLTMDSKVYTPTGPVAMRDITVGMEVLAPEGTSTVLGVYPQGMKPVYNVTFSDGTVVTCSRDHLWRVGYQYTGKRVIYRTVTTGALMRLSSSRINRIFIDCASAFDYEAQDIPCNPYT